MPQFQIVNFGSLVGFIPLTETATEWWDENVQEGPALGHCRYVEHRYAGDIVEGLEQEGLI